MKSLLITLLALALVSGCSSMQSPAQQSSAASPSAAISSSERGDQMFNVLAGELAGKYGDLPLAVEYYVRASLESDDPRLASRATRVAEYAQKNDQALVAAHRWLELQPASLEAKQYLGLIYTRRGEIDSAVRYLSEVSEQTAGLHNGSLSLVTALLSEEENNKATAEVMQRLAANYADDSTAQSDYAGFALRAGQFKEAEAAANRAILLDASNVSARVIRARARLELGDASAAFADMQALIEEYPQQEEIRVHYGRMLVAAKRYGDALEQFEFVLAMRPDDAELLYTIGLLSVEAKEFDAANDYFQRLLNLGKRVNVAHYYLGRIAEQQGNDRIAISWFLKVTHGEYLTDAQARVALAFARLGRVDNARDHLSALRNSTNDKDQQIYFWLAEMQILKDVSEFEEAMSVADEAMLSFPEDPDLLYSRALIAEKIGRVDILEKNLRTILATDPENADALNALGYTLADKTKRYDEALQLIQQALVYEPDDPAVKDSMGWVQYRMGNLMAAENWLRKAYAQLQDPEIVGHLLEVLVALDKQPEASAILREALADYPEAPELLGWKARLLD